MTFKDYLFQAWSTHAENPRSIAEDFKKNLPLVSTPEDVASFSQLIAHVCAEHLGDWLMGIELLKKLKNNPLHKDKIGMNRFVAILELGNNPTTSLDHLAPTDQVRVLASTASALSNLGGLKRADSYLKKALEIAAELPKDDPAHKSLAVTANNLACALEEKKDRTEQETEFMILSANVAREYWEIAGTWKEVERAEYRLARTYLEAKILDRAFEHAEKCLEIISAHDNEPLEIFFAYEALALVEKAKKNEMGFLEAKQNMEDAFKKLKIDDQGRCRVSLDKLSC